MNSDWKQEKNFSTGVANARKAKKLRDEAEGLEKSAKESLTKVRKARYEYLKNLYESKKEELSKLIEEQKKQYKQKDEYVKSACAQLGHVYKVTERKVLNYSSPKHTYMGAIYSMKLVEKCIVCGKRRSYCTEGRATWREITPEIPEEYEKMLAKASTQYTEEINSKIRIVEDELEEIESSIYELCQLFGHDAYPTDYCGNYFKCKCCEKTMRVEEYVNDFVNSSYKGIVSYHFESNPKIL